MIPLSEPNVSGNEWSYVKECLDTGWLSTGGAYVERLERDVCELTGVAGAAACASGTAALHVALILAGVRAGDAVLVPTLTFIAPVNAVRYCGAEPVLLDCDEHMNLDPAEVRRFLEKECAPSPNGPVDSATGRIVRAIVAVHVFGAPCDMAALAEIAHEHGLGLIEDASESLGSVWTQGPLAGRHAGTTADFGVLSFNANKIVTAGGGGMVLTRDEPTAEHVRYLTTQAKDDPVRYVHGDVGFNYRMTNVAAAIACAQLERLAEFVATKRANWQRYREGLAGVPGLSMLDDPPGTRSNRWHYALSVEPSEAGIDREDLMAALATEGIQSRPVWELVHRQLPYADARALPTPRAERFHQRVLNLPCSTGLLGEDLDVVVTAVRAAVGG